MAGAQQEMEVVENEVMMLLPELEADQLEEVCALAPVVIPEAAKGNKNQLLRLLLKHLLALDEDNGFATFRVIHEKLTNKGDGDDARVEDAGVKNPDVTKTDVKVEKNEEKGNFGGSKAVVDVYQLKNFKINGMIGGLGEKDKLPYSSLSYQIENGRKMGFSEEKICAAVIKAISPSNHLRTYFESIPNLNLPAVQEILRSHFRKKDSAAVFTDLAVAKQLGTESCMDFVLRIVCVRKSLLCLPRKDVHIMKRC